MQAPHIGGPVEERPLRELLAELSRDGSLLVQQEIALAKQELSDKVGHVKRHAATIAVGGVLCQMAALALTAGIILLLALAMPAWVSAILVGVALAVVGGTLLMTGKKRLGQVDLKLEKTSESVQRDVQALKEVTRER
jgi:hypothetical protein